MEYINSIGNEIYNLTNTYPKKEMYSLISQIKRVAILIPANIAEGLTFSTRKPLFNFCTYREDLYMNWKL
jgi:four helix bundle protein